MQATGATEPRIQVTQGEPCGKGLEKASRASKEAGEKEQPRAGKGKAKVCITNRASAVKVKGQEGNCQMGMEPTTANSLVPQSILNSEYKA